ncbi:hypothetical protein EKM01_12150 [Flavobacterium sp. RSP46]|uniref:hypothetical protein n=1 Tax=Flavobacterium sp. RSP46 TaxID=2497486 RepID=UPI000F887CF3|nr:hypothetical protein [Flavobacterium sp. RSP46]RTY89862.1 hypothetical protein EKM01_12150 [Flavobacterium sp. RSP46]
MIEINSIEDFKEYLLNHELSKFQISEILKKTLKVWISDEYNKTDLVNMIEDFYYKYPNIQERPLFLDVPVKE